MLHAKKLQITQCILAAIVALFMTTTAFAQSGFNIVEQVAPITVVPKGLWGTLIFSVNYGGNEVSYQWYRTYSDPSRVDEKIEGANSSAYGTNAMNEGDVRFYGCGPTVYNYPHIGNMRAFVFYDLFNRYLRYKGYKVTFCMNMTDVDDKTIRDSQKAGKTLREFTDFYAAEFLKDCATLHIQKPDIIPRATEEIPAMVELIQNLLDKGYAYQTEKGDIYFKISAFADYGQMAGIDAKSLRTNADGRLSADDYDKEKIGSFMVIFDKAYKKQL